MSAARLLAAAGLVVVVGAGCSSAPEVVIEGDPADALARAATVEVGTVRFVHETRLIGDTFEARQTTEGLIEPDGDSHLVMDTAYRYPEGPANEFEEQLGRGSVTVEMISVDGAVYQKGELAGSGPLPEGIEWSVSGGVSSSAGISRSSIDASGYLEPLEVLEWLEEAVEVEDRGATDIDGVPVRHLHAMVSASEEDRLADGPVGMDVYLTGDGQVRRVVWEVSRQEHRVEATIDYLDLNATETVQPPPSEKTIQQSELWD